MLFGAVGMAISMAVLAGTTSVTGTAPGIVAAAFLFIFNTFFAIGWLGMTWLYPAEIVPLRIRAPANALSTSANWAFNVSLPKPMMLPWSFSVADNDSSWSSWSRLSRLKASDTKRTLSSLLSTHSSFLWSTSSILRRHTEGQ